MRRQGSTPAALVLVIAAAACTTETDTAPPAPASSPVPPSASPAPEPPVPTLAGGAEALAVAPLPDGPATGTAVLTYSGVGEVREPFEGECTHEGDTTIVEGVADTARIRLVIAPDGAELALDDTGFAATSSLTTGTYVVAGDHLSLAAGLAQDGQPVGTAELEIDCGS